MRRTLAVALVAALSAAWTVLAGASATQPPRAGRPAHAEGWVIVRLQAPVADAAALRTGLPEVDTAMAELRIRSIRPALSRAAATAHPGGVFSRSPLARTYRFDLPAGLAPEAAIGRLAGLPGVEWAEVDPLGHGAASFPDDISFSNQWGFHQTSDKDVDAPEAWDVTRGDARVVLAVIDSGADLPHEDFAGKLVPGWDFVNNDDTPQDDHGHGSNVASIAAAASNNGRGIAGACWNCLIMPLKALDANNQGYYSWWADALVYAADHGGQAVNLSAGGSSSSTLLRDGIRYAYGTGLPIATSMMNNDNAVPYYPANYPETIAIGATNQSDQRAVPFCWGGGSSYGPHIDVSAPGELIQGVRWGGGYNYWCGTSQATPLVTGLAGLIFTVNRAAGREEVRHLVQAGAEDRVGRVGEDLAGFDPYHGWGRVNMDRTVRAAHALTTLTVQRSPGRVALAVPIAIATSYDVIRGDVASLTETAAGVRTGSVVCLANDSANPVITGAAVDADPAPGRAFFYLARFTAAPGAGSYGGSSRHRDRTVAQGDCPL